jgi:hypothetical protein
MKIIVTSKNGGFRFATKKDFQDHGIWVEQPKNPMFKPGDRVRLTDEGFREINVHLTRKQARAALDCLTVKEFTYIPLDDAPGHGDLSFEEIPYNICSVFAKKV